MYAGRRPWRNEYRASRKQYDAAMKLCLPVTINMSTTPIWARTIISLSTMIPYNYSSITWEGKYIVHDISLSRRLICARQITSVEINSADVEVITKHAELKKSAATKMKKLRWLEWADEASSLVFHDEIIVMTTTLLPALKLMVPRRKRQFWRHQSA